MVIIYMSLTCHFNGVYFTRQTVSLDVVPYNHMYHTAASIASLSQCPLENWGMQHKVHKSGTNGYGLIQTLVAEVDGLSTTRADLLHILKTQYIEMGSNQFYAVGILLYPRLKDTVFSSSEAADKVKQLLLAEMSKVDICIAMANFQKFQPSKFNLYFSENLFDTSINPLQYWKSAQHKSLRHVAKVTLSASCGSVTSERLFSTSGLLCNKKRSFINTEKLKQIVIVNKNLCYIAQ
ncbi:hypothetical protein PR048_020227 [Dryococelus australis]|uniref:HAT C-terminal dimerisation domain-containing protein n=1 Tax=Dryococelus australis TaxID=614101 RepID=A0ABQ9H5Q0_9NEOP|nr:hypothetical protein PR048_020227 [Dryococelus australis]